MYCNKCGEKISVEANYCLGCGVKINKPNIKQPIENTLRITKESQVRQRCSCGEIQRNIYNNYEFTGQVVCGKCMKKGYCPVCGNKLRTKTAEQCGQCGSSWRINPPSSDVQTRNHNFQKKFNKTADKEEKVKCPKCWSTQITANKKGFSGINAFGGAIVAGGIGLLAGTIGSNKILLTCLSCGNNFKVGEDYEGLKRQRKQEQESMKSPIFWILFIGFMVFLIWLISTF